MQTLAIVESTPESKPAFLRRQFSDLPSRVQREFDWAGGVILPIICIAADPIVFRSSFGLPRPVLAEYQVGAYAISSVAILAMTAWLLWGDRLGELRPYIAGILIASSIVSTIVGIVLLPLSVIGLFFFLFGALGFVPLLSGFILMRNAVRMLRSSTEAMPHRHIYQAAILAALYAVVIPIVLNFR